MATTTDVAPPPEPRQRSETSKGIGEPSPPPVQPQQVTNSIAGLRSISSAITAFQERYDDLLNHLHSIQSAIATKSQSREPEASNSSQALLSPKPNNPKSKKPQKGQDQDQEDVDVVSLCKTMSKRRLKKYMLAHRENASKLREEVPRALKHSPNPARLVLESFGKFFVQGKKGFEKEIRCNAARDAKILMLECFLLMISSCQDEGKLDIESSVREEAEASAMAWRKRLLVEGGLNNAEEIDARGLLLFIACFGVPKGFTKENMRDLVVAGKRKDVAELLRKSSTFMDMMIEMVEGMIKYKMELDAVDMIYTFGLEERFNPQSILVRYRLSNASIEKIKQGAPDSRSTWKVGKRRELDSLKLVKSCLEKHEIDPEKLLPGWKINEKIAELEKALEELDKNSEDKTSQKRKASETEPSPRNPYPQDPKRYHHNISHSPQQPKPLTSQAIDYSSTPPVVYGSSLSTSRAADLYLTSNYVHGRLSPLDMSVQSSLSRSNKPYSWQADEALIEKYTGKSSSIGLTGLYRASTPSVEAFPGLSHHASSLNAGNGASETSDLYNFADAIVESESGVVGFRRPQL